MPDRSPVITVPVSESTTERTSRGESCPRASSFARRICDYKPAFRVHVVGCPRSGTTLMSELLRHAYEFPEQTLHEQSLFKPIDSVSYPYLSKKPSDTVRLGKVIQADQDLYVIAMVRDPRSVVTSKHWSSTAEKYFVGFSRWRETIEAVNSLRPKHRCLVVRYEDLINDPEGVQRTLELKLRFLKRRNSFSSFATEARYVPQHSIAAMKGVRDFESSRIAAWQEHLPRLRSELNANPDLPQWLIETGYETDSSWVKRLANVIPSGETCKPANKGLLARIENHARYWLKERRYLRTRRRLRRTR